MPFNVGPGELLVILIVALLLFGPKKLPELGKALGEGINSFKRALNSPTGETKVEQPLPPEPVASPVVSQEQKGEKAVIE